MFFWHSNCYAVIERVSYGNSPIYICVYIYIHTHVFSLALSAKIIRIPSGILSGILSEIFSGILSGGWSSAVPTAIRTSPAEVRRWQLRSGAGKEDKEEEREGEREGETNSDKKWPPSLTSSMWGNNSWQCSGINLHEKLQQRGRGMKSMVYHSIDFKPLALARLHACRSLAFIKIGKATAFRSAGKLFAELTRSCGTSLCLTTFELNILNYKYTSTFLWISNKFWKHMW